MDHFTSRTACDRIADRAVRTLIRTDATHIPALQETLHPAFRQLVNGGKLSRPAFRETWSRLVALMRALPNVVDLRIDDLRTSRASANDRGRIRCVFETAARERQVEFMTCHLTMSRHGIACRIEITNVIVTSHLLSRFMQHKRQEPDAFLRNVTRTLQAARMVMPATRHAAGRRTALAYGEDLLLGECLQLDGPAHNRFAPIDLVFDKTGMVDSSGCQPVDPAGPIDVLELRTYVADHATGLANTAIRDMLNAWHDRHAEGIETAFHTLPPAAEPTWPKEETERLAKLANEARTAMEALVRHPRWARFSSRNYAMDD